jgi:hypothetical protein
MAHARITTKAPNCSPNVLQSIGNTASLSSPLRVFPATCLLHDLEIKRRLIAWLYKDLDGITPYQMGHPQATSARLL